MKGEEMTREELEELLNTISTEINPIPVEANPPKWGEAWDAVLAEFERLNKELDGISELWEATSQQVNDLKQENESLKKELNLK